MRRGAAIANLAIQCSILGVPFRFCAHQCHTGRHATSIAATACSRFFLTSEHTEEQLETTADGEALAINGDYFGNMVNLAARLVSAARPGQILVTEAVQDGLPNCPARAAEPLALKGFDEPVAAYELLGTDDPT